MKENQPNISAPFWPILLITGLLAACQPSQEEVQSRAVFDDMRIREIRAIEQKLLGPIDLGEDGPRIIRHDGRNDPLMRSQAMLSRCNAVPLMNYIGQPLQVIELERLPISMIRVLRFGREASSGALPSRLNIQLDPDQSIRKIWCG